jgi:hypothetical protein
MAHFAQLDENNTVIQVIVVNNSEIIDSNGNENEILGINFCKNLLGGNWMQTSYNANFRKNFAGIGFTYDAVRDAFIAPKPYASWLFNEETCQWYAPIQHPQDNQIYIWDEDTVSWILQ